jgi:hypothetical protein
LIGLAGAWVIASAKAKTARRKRSDGGFVIRSLSDKCALIVFCG